MRSSKKSVKQDSKKQDANAKITVEEVKPEKTEEVIEAENKIKFSLGLNNILPESKKDENAAALSKRSTSKLNMPYESGMQSSIKSSARSIRALNAADPKISIDSGNSSLLGVVKPGFQVEKDPNKKIGEQYNPNTTQEMNYFAFETDVRKKMYELIDPLFEHQVQDRKTLATILIENKQMSDRLAYVEGIFEDHQGKNVVFDRMKEQILDGEVEQKKFITHVQGLVDQLLEKQDMINLKLDSQKTMFENQMACLDQMKQQQVDDVKFQEQQNFKILANIESYHKQDQEACLDVQKKLIEYKIELDNFVSNYQNMNDEIGRSKNFIQKLSETLSITNDNLSQLKVDAAFEKVQVDRFNQVEEYLKKADNSIDDLRNAMLTTDNYIDKYLAFKLQKQISSTLKDVFHVDKYKQLDLQTQASKLSEQKSTHNSRPTSHNHQNQQRPTTAMSHANQAFDNCEMMQKIQAVEHAHLKELYAKILSDTGHPPDFKRQLEALQIRLGNQYPKLFNLDSTKLNQTHFHHDCTISRKFQIIGDKPNIVDLKKQATDYIYKRDLCLAADTKEQKDEEEKAIYSQFCDVLSRFLGPDEISPEVYNRFAKVEKRINNLHDKIQGFEIVADGLKGVNIDVIQENHDELSTRMQMQVDTLIKQFEAVKELTMQEATRSGHLTRAMRLIEKEISDLKGSDGNGPATFDGFDRSVFRSHKDTASLESQIQNLSQIVTVLVESMVIDQGIQATIQESNKSTHDVASMKTTAFNTQAEVTAETHQLFANLNPVVKTQTIQQPDYASNYATMVNASNPHRRIKALSANKIDVNTEKTYTVNPTFKPSTVSSGQNGSIQILPGKILNIKGQQMGKNQNNIQAQNIPRPHSSISINQPRGSNTGSISGSYTFYDQDTKKQNSTKRASQNLEFKTPILSSNAQSRQDKQNDQGTFQGDQQKAVETLAEEQPVQKNEDPIVLKSNVIKSPATANMDQQQLQIVYANRVMRVWQLSKLRFNMIKKCWQQVSNQQPFTQQATTMCINQFVTEGLKDLNQTYMGSSMSLQQKRFDCSFNENDPRYSQENFQDSMAFQQSQKFGMNSQMSKRSTGSDFMNSGIGRTIYRTKDKFDQQRYSIE